MGEGGNLRRELLGRRSNMRDNYAGGKELKRWNSYGDVWHEYQNAFETVFPEGIDQWLKERKAKGLPTMVLDVMAPAGALSSLKRDVGIQGGVALTLENLHSAQYNANLAKDNIHIVDGDVVRKSTWRKLQSFVQEHNVNGGKGFDLVMARPLGGIYNIPNHRDIYFHLLQRLYQNVSSNDGTLLTAVPSYSRTDLPALQAILEKTSDVEYRIAESIYNGSPMLMLHKHAQAPAQLITGA